ncbi:leucine--tRNA ligase [Mesoplasma whartonense]|uniref:leucine--tRNA ligase n=1 Tax=Mesoplasma whartonense TaxID=2878854 RepID=UPI0020229F5C|nr:MULTISPECIES: leucine--tRNA ligase [unclassified Mesoplasma]MCL8212538.1 Leucine--tRNA ligase [Mesoplasma sp. JKS002661]MCL8215960.1 Leucine--tRNA ligase [Mesoplasma sp. JKS002657]
MDFSHRAIEKKWRLYWEQNKTYQTTNTHDKKSYILDMFPYPSGSGLHVGHVKGYTATDIIARYKRMNGYDVLHPIGYDAFGLPAEQYALKTGNDPREFTLKNIAVFREQLQKLGFSYDYEKEVNTSHPNFYKTTQWIFEQLYQQGLAELRYADVNWCPELGTVLANEEVIVVDNKMVSEVGGFPVVKKPMRQWVLLITKYADKLLTGLDALDWPSSVKELQRNWIGKSEGMEINFLTTFGDELKVFTTRPDTIYGVTYLVLAPENPIISKLTAVEQKASVEAYQELTQQKTELERKDDSRPKTGVFLGSYALHPLTGEKLPIWIADYVLNDYATGAVMAVPAHDTRDWEFAQKFNLPIKFVLESKSQIKPFIGDAKHINSETLNGLTTTKALSVSKKILSEQKIGVVKTNYKLRDWLFSRQRFYGEPFPVLYNDQDEIILVDPAQLPVTLPSGEYIKPSGTGESPLANFPDWVNIEQNNQHYRRETNTMPQWAGSSWYFLAYILTNTPNELIDINSPEARERFKKWLPVDLYVGGQEHAVLHLLYARFWNQVLFDQKIVPYAEPFQKLVNQGMILGPNGEKMSKSKGNVINPDEIIETHGADALRLYEMFMGPIDASLPWSYEGLDGAMKWLNRVYRLVSGNQFSHENNHHLDFVYHQVVKNYTEMITDLKFNTAISQLMVLVNAMYKEESVTIYQPYVEGLILMLSVITPYLGEEMWSLLGHEPSVILQPWPVYDAEKLVLTTTTVVFQVNGKVRGKAVVKKGLSQQELIALAKKDPHVEAYLSGKEIVKEIVVLDKIVNFVIE